MNNICEHVNELKKGQFSLKPHNFFLINKLDPGVLLNAT